MDLKFKKLAFQKNKLQLLNLNHPGCSFGQFVPSFIFLIFLSNNIQIVQFPFFLNSVRMSNLFIMLSVKPEEHIKGSNLVILSKLPNKHLKLHGWKDLAD